MNIDRARELIHEAQENLNQALVELEEDDGNDELKVVQVPEGGDLQAAINAATDPTEIRVYPATFGSISIPARSNKLVIRADTSNIPLNKRVNPDWASDMFKIQCPVAYPGIYFEQKATNIQIQGCQILASSDPIAPFIRVGHWEETDPTRVPVDNVIDQCLMLANPDVGGKRGIEANCGSLFVRCCHIDGFWYQNDSQAVTGWNGQGPFIIEDNFLVSSGENVLFGGEDARSEGMLPGLVIIRGNTLTKPLDWRDKPGTTVKNVVELKACLQAVIENNLIEHSWTSGQVGYLVMFTPRNQNGSAPYTQVKDVLFQYNVVRNAGAGFNLLGFDDINESKQTTNIQIKQNLVYGIDPWMLPGAGRCIQMLDGCKDIEISHNTIIAKNHGTFLTPEGPRKNTLRFNDNVVYEGEYGIMGSGMGPGIDSWNAGVENATFNNNLISRGTARWINYPQGSYQTEPGVDPLDCQTMKLKAEFANLQSSDGTPIGCDVDQVLQKTGVVL